MSFPIQFIPIHHTWFKKNKLRDYIIQIDNMSNLDYAIHVVHNFSVPNDLGLANTTYNSIMGTINKQSFFPLHEGSTIPIGIAKQVYLTADYAGGISDNANYPDAFNGFTYIIVAPVCYMGNLVKGHGQGFNFTYPVELINQDKLAVPSEIFDSAGLGRMTGSNAIYRLWEIKRVQIVANMSLAGFASIISPAGDGAQLPTVQILDITTGGTPIKRWISKLFFGMNNQVSLDGNIAGGTSSFVEDSLDIVFDNPLKGIYTSAQEAIAGNKGLGFPMVFVDMTDNNQNLDSIKFLFEGNLQHFGQRIGLPI